VLNIVLLYNRSELNLFKFSRMRQLEKLRLRSVSGLTLANDCTLMTSVEGLVHLKVLVSTLCWILFSALLSYSPLNKNHTL